jgi:hypothetical protein
MARTTKTTDTQTFTSDRVKIQVRSTIAWGEFSHSERNRLHKSTATRRIFDIQKQDGITNAICRLGEHYYHVAQFGDTDKFQPIALIPDSDLIDAS